jgi:hypothetical protein
MISKRPRARVVVLDGTRSAPVLVEAFEVTTQEKDPAGQVHDVATSFANRVKGLAVDRVMIQRADYYKIPSNQEGPRIRLLVEGALTFAAREQVADTHVAVGRDVASTAGLTKDALAAQAGAVVGDDDFSDACGAALAVIDP